jgi:hypothetical protein
MVSRILSPEKIVFSEKERRQIGDGSKNSLYKVEVGGSVHYFTVNDILDKKFIDRNTTYISSDMFWSPEACAQMISFYTPRSIFFFETKVSNPDENNGEYFVNYIHVFDIEQKNLTTYTSSKYFNLASVKQRYISDDRHKVEIYIQNKDFKTFRAEFDFQKFEVNTGCNWFTCDYMPPDFSFKKVDATNFEPNVPQELRYFRVGE